MKKKYTINSEDVTKKHFFATLRGDCRKVVSTSAAGEFGVDLCDYDDEKYQHALRSLRAGRMVVLTDTGRTYAYYPCPESK